MITSIEKEKLNALKGMFIFLRKNVLNSKKSLENFMIIKFKIILTVKVVQDYFFKKKKFYCFSHFS